MSTQPVRDRCPCLLPSTAAVSGVAATASIVVLALFYSKLNPKVLAALVGTSSMGGTLCITTAILSCRSQKKEAPPEPSPNPSQHSSRAPSPEPFAAHQADSVDSDDDDEFFDAMDEDEAKKAADAEAEQVVDAEAAARAAAEAEQVVDAEATTAAEEAAKAEFLQKIQPISEAAEQLALNLVELYFNTTKETTIDVVLHDVSAEKKGTILVDEKGYTKEKLKAEVQTAFVSLKEILSSKDYREMDGAEAKVTELLLVLPGKLLGKNPTQFGAATFIFFDPLKNDSPAPYYNAHPNWLYNGGCVDFDEKKSLGFGDDVLEHCKRVAALLTPIMSQYCNYKSKFQKPLATILGKQKGKGCPDLATLERINSQFKSS